MSVHHGGILGFIYNRIEYLLSLFFTGALAETFWPELIHGVASIITAVLVVVAVYFAKRVLKKYFP